MQLQAIFAKALEELSDMSGAKVGDKTMMDALIPASQAIARMANSVFVISFTSPLR